MAARTGASIGVAVTITILGALSLAFFVTTMVFYGQAQRAKNDLTEAQESYDDFISSSQREQAAIRAILDEARQNRQTVVEYLAANRSELIGNITGDDSTSMTEYRDRLARFDDANEGALFDLLSRKNDRIASLNEQLTEAESARIAAQDFAQAEAERVAAIEASFNETAGRMQANMDDYATRVSYVDGTIDNVEEKLNNRIDEVRADSGSEVDRLQNLLDQTVRDNNLLRDQLADLRGQGKSDRLLPLNEAELVDGAIDQVISENDEVLISIGRKDKAVLGMTFAVYSTATDIGVENAEGDYAPGKAVIEIVNVQDDFSRARIITQSQGNPIIRGDIIANAVYDPKKTYKFVVDGLFDIDGDGIARRHETDDLAALIEQWGGTVEDEVVGDIDFIVLGEKPTLPPPPGPGAPVAAIQEYVRLQREIQRYDELLVRAEDASIPLLNANRLQTLIGDFPN